MTIFVIIVLTAAAFAFVARPLLKQRLNPVSGDEDDHLRELESRRDMTYSMLKEVEFDYESGLMAEEDFRDLQARYKDKAVSLLRNIDEAEQGADVGDEIEEQVRTLRGTRTPPPARQEPARQEPVRQEPTRQEPVRQEPVRQEPVRQGDPVEDAIEEQVRKLRKSKGPAPVTQPPAGQAPARQAPARAAGKAAATPGRPAASPRQTKRRFCTQCGEQLAPGDRFCGDCGAGVSRGGGR